MDIKFIMDDVYEKSLKDLNEIISHLSLVSGSRKVMVGERFINAMVVARKSMTEKKKIGIKEIVRDITNKEPMVIKQSIFDIEGLKNMAPKLDDDLNKFKTQYPIIIFRGLKRGVIVKNYMEDKEGKLFYKVEEKEIDKEIFEGIKNIFFERFLKERKIAEDEGFVRKLTKKVCKTLKKEFKDEMVDLVRYYLIRDFLGFGRIEPLIEDEMINVINCKGVNKPITIGYGVGKLIETNVMFDDENELSVLIKTMAEKIGEEISDEKPHIDGFFMNFRIQANLGVGGMSSNFVVSRAP